MWVAILGAAPPAEGPRYGPVPNGPQTAIVTRYVDALRAGNYDAAFALLTEDEHRYSGSANAFRSVFEADGIVVKSAWVVGARGDARLSARGWRQRLADRHHRQCR